jgi:hypothetical protein
MLMLMLMPMPCVMCDVGCVCCCCQIDPCFLPRQLLRCCCGIVPCGCVAESTIMTVCCCNPGNETNGEANK